ncbi:hypothetical protein AB0J57_11965 [Streptomyces sp. NPDC049837]|uniref:hypothetical protein n=1 Tax=Streptomyces sp. NPDC049837 TaxID=3155277 RepID=UPI0034463B43
MNLRVIGLGAVVVATALLPLAASAGPAGSPGAPAAPAQSALLAGIDAPAAPPAPAPSPSPSHEASLSSCGPEVASPEGLDAQTCVVTEGGDTWARAYYRNTSGAPIRVALTLMAPGGRTVQTHCEALADDEPGVCETPREPSRGMPAEYSAVAEFADSAGERLLLRAGSNSADPAAS